MRWISAVFLVCVPLLLAACAATVKYQPSALDTNTTTLQPRKLEATVDIRFDTGYSRTLRAGTEWLPVGTLPQGKVYKPKSSVFTLEGEHIHEAWLVVAGDQLVGFYLPVERGYSPLRQRLPVLFSSTPQ